MQTMEQALAELVLRRNDHDEVALSRLELPGPAARAARALRLTSEPLVERRSPTWTAGGGLRWQSPGTPRSGRRRSPSGASRESRQRPRRAEARRGASEKVSPAEARARGDVDLEEGDLFPAHVAGEEEASRLRPPSRRRSPDSVAELLRPIAAGPLDPVVLAARDASEGSRPLLARIPTLTPVAPEPAVVRARSRAGVAIEPELPAPEPEAAPEPDVALRSSSTREPPSVRGVPEVRAVPMRRRSSRRSPRSLRGRGRSPRFQSVSRRAFGAAGIRAGGRPRSAPCPSCPCPGRLVRASGVRAGPVPEPPSGLADPRCPEPEPSSRRCRSGCGSSLRARRRCWSRSSRGCRGPRSRSRRSSRSRPNRSRTRRSRPCRCRRSPYPSQPFERRAPRRRRPSFCIGVAAPESRERRPAASRKRRTRSRASRHAGAQAATRTADRRAGKSVELPRRLAGQEAKRRRSSASASGRSAREGGAPELHKRLVGLKIGGSQIAAAQVVNKGGPRIVRMARAPSIAASSSAASCASPTSWPRP